MPRKLPTKTRMTARLDKVASELCKVLADYQCQKCGLPWNMEPWPQTNLEWAHIEVRNHKAIRWDMNNCLALCNHNGNGCHYWFDHSKVSAVAWLKEAYPKKYEWLREEVDGTPRSEMLSKWTVPDLMELESKLKEDLENARPNTRFL